MATAAGAVGGAYAAGYASTCRASLIRVSVAGTTVLEPVVATGCAGMDAGPGNPGKTAGPVDFRLLYASTHPTAPNAEAGVADVTIRLSTFDPRLPDLGVRLLTSEASVACAGTQPVLTSRSRVLGVTVNGVDQVVIPPGDAPQSLPANPLLSIALNERTVSGTTVTQRALHLHTLPGTVDLDIAVAESQAGYAGNPCAPPPPPPPPPAGAVGWMTGGGQLPGSITHSLVLPCTLTQKHPGPKLHVETPNGFFDLSELAQVGCSTVAANGDPEQPDAGFNTLTGRGTGACNGHDGVDVSFIFTDGGEPNKGNDKAAVTIDKDSRYGCHVAVSGATVNGNQQAHRGGKPPA